MTGHCVIPSCDAQPAKYLTSAKIRPFSNKNYTPSTTQRPPSPFSFSPGLSGVGRFRFHRDQVRSRETANRSRASGEKAIWVTVRVWHGSVCSCRHVDALHSSTAACSALDAWKTEFNHSMCRHKRIFRHLSKCVCFLIHVCVGYYSSLLKIVFLYFSRRCQKENLETKWGGWRTHWQSQRLNLHQMIHVTPFWFLSGGTDQICNMKAWVEKKRLKLDNCQIGFQPPSYVKINWIWFRYLPGV